MQAKDYRDILGGLALVLIGTFALVHALISLRLGTPAQMGPGMFPAALGFILAALGVAILIPALFRGGELPSVDLRSTVAILAAILAFALTITPFGMVPAILLLVVIASRANSKLSPIGTVVTAAILSLGAAMLFPFALGVPVSIISWPW